MYDNDMAIKYIKDDKIGRANFSIHLADSIIKHKNPDNLVIGISGKWGSGKTSIINMVLDYMRKEYINSQRISPEKEPIIIEFNPWNFSNQNQLVSQFFNELSVKLGNSNYDNIKKVAEKLELYASFFEPIGMALPPFGLLIKLIKKYIISIKELAGYKLNNLEDMRKELDKALRSQDHKIIIAMDDIDRLNNEEISQIFQLIKLIADFPNTVYIIGFDRDVVTNALNTSNNSEISNFGLEYLEKIVQITLEVPPISDIEIREILMGEIDKVIDGFQVTKDDEKRFMDLYEGKSGYNLGLKKFFKNIRNVKRYMNTLNFGFEIIKEEVDAVDFFIISTIKLFLPKLYEEIINNKDVFVYSSNPIYQIHPNKKNALLRDLCDEIFKKVEMDNSQILYIMRGLFPKLDLIYGDLYYDDQRITEWKNQGRICIEDNFDTYFRLSVPEWELSTKEAKAILLNTDDRVTFENILVNLEDIKIIKFLDFLYECSSLEKINLSNHNIRTIFEAILNKGDYLCIKGNRIDLNIYFILTNLGFHLLDEKERFNLFNKSIGSANDSLYILVYVVSALEEQYLTHADSLADNDILLDIQHIEDLKKLVCKKIEIWASNDILGYAINLYYILLYWKKWGHIGKLRTFLDKDPNLVAYLTSFLTASGNNEIDFLIDKNVRWPSYLKDVKEFIDLNELKSRIESIVGSTYFQNLDSRDQFVLSTLLETLNEQK